VKTTFLLILYSIGIIVSSQELVLDSYINTALESNLSLQQKQASYEKSVLALKEARGLFFPNVGLNARYTVAEGGRIIKFPLGDLLNPIYNSLNRINQEYDLPTGFPLLENEEFPFYRPTEQETKLRITQPIFNKEIFYNQQIKKDLMQVEKAGVDVYRRELVYEVKSAYYQYWQTAEVLDLIDNTYELLDENIRVNEKLFENNMVTADNVFKSKAELSKLEQKKAEAFKNYQMAGAYFNFLLNRDLNAQILPDSAILKMNVRNFNLNELIANSLNEREEIKQLEYYQSVNRKVTKLKQSGTLPNLTGVVDYGFQGEEYSFTRDNDFILASVVLQWNLFQGLQNKRKIEQARIDEMIIRDKMMEARQNINLQIVNSYYSLESAFKNIEAARSVLEASEQTFNIVRKKFNQGQVPLIEYIDARNEYTKADQNLIIAKYDYLIKYADFERVTCMYQFD